MLDTEKEKLRRCGGWDQETLVGIWRAADEKIILEPGCCYFPSTQTGEDLILPAVGDAAGAHEGAMMENSTQTL